MSYNQPNYPQPQPGYPQEFPEAQPAKAGTSGLTITGFILAFLIAPVGFILSLIGLIQAGRARRKGKGLAIAGIIVSLLIMGGGTAAAIAIGGRVATVLDPGCTTGKAAILDNADKVADTATTKEALQATVDGLKAAAAKSNHDNVRAAMTALADDYSQLLAAIDGGTQPDASLQGKITTDATTIDTLCTAGA
jgi:hypothetical protein